MINDKLRLQEEIKRWLKEAMVRSAKTQSQLADAVGVTRQAVSLWTRTGQIQIGLLRRAEEFLGELSPVSRSVIQSESYGLSSPFGEERRKSANIVVKTTTWEDISKDDQDIEAVGSMICPAIHSDSTYALKIEPYSMIKLFAIGDHIFVDKEMNPRNGDYIVVKLQGDEESVLRKYRKEAGKIYLTADNEQYGQLIIDNPEQITIIGVVIGSYKSLRM
jgi:SOS-response transcriptional repressor LexA